MPVENDTPNIANSCRKENTPPSRFAKFARSPQPYNRDKEGIPDAILTPDQSRVEASTASTEVVVSYLTASHPIQKQRNGLPYSTSPSDSGTEADDESGPILKGLPAPPIKWRKGLRAEEGQGTASPLLTPSYLDDDERRLVVERQLARSATTRTASTSNDEILKIREKFTRRRRAELLRRISETVLLGLVGSVACAKDLGTLQMALGAGKATVRGIMRQAEWNAELLSHLGIVLGIYLSYPLRLLYRHRSQGSHSPSPWKFLRIPAAFDPATLLYPVFVPMLVASSIAPSYPAVVISNIMLSIASIPRAILPIHDDLLGHSPFHWMSSLVPLLTFQFHDQIPSYNGAGDRQNLGAIFDYEMLALLFPLHQALLPTLGYLTTTSLLPAELQLLSTAMINVLLHSNSPQALILKALLWIGGIAMFILCGRVLRWVVILARIPNWRFRHPRLRSREGSVLLSAVDDCFHTSLSKMKSTSSESEHSSDEGIGRKKAGTVTIERSRRLKLAILEGSGSQMNGQAPLSARPQGLPSVDSSLSSVYETPQPMRRSQRRYTLPAYSTAPASTEIHKRPDAFRKPRFVRGRSRKWTSLTTAQATATKWLFASYIYAAVITIIAWPIRKYISRRALHGHEPVGWALGYLFGHVPLFRHYVLEGSLEDWIVLPEPYDIYTHIVHPNGSTLLDQCFKGAANVRLLLCIYCAISIMAGLAVVFRLKDFVEVDTRRKVFHGMMVVMFLPATFVDPAFVALALVLVLAIFLLLDLFRASQLPPLSKPLTDFLAPYVDGRDYQGPVIVSHIFLLIGSAIPLWLSLAATDRTGEAPWEGWDVSWRELSMVSGVICVGMGDAAASLIGRRFGRRRWCWSGGKSLEGSLAFALAVIVGLCLGRAWLLLGGWAGDSGDAWSLTLGKAAVAATSASLTEAILTGGNDNVVVPVILWLMVRGLRI